MTERYCDRCTNHIDTTKAGIIGWAYMRIRVIQGGHLKRRLCAYCFKDFMKWMNRIER